MSRLSLIRPAAFALALLPFTHAEDFSGFQPGAFLNEKNAEGEWSAGAGQATIDRKQKNERLRLTGGEDKSVRFTPQIDLSRGGELHFLAERWTGREPFSFAIVGVDAAGKTTKIFDGDKAVRTGSLQKFSTRIPAGTVSLIFRSTTPANAGVVLDNIVAEPESAMRIVSTRADQPVIPVLIRKKDNPVVGVNIVAKGNLTPLRVKRVKVTLSGTDNLADIAAVRLGIRSKGAANVQANGEAIANSDFVAVSDATKPTAPTLDIACDIPLTSGDNDLRILIEPAAGASLDRRIDAGVTAITFSDGTTVTPDNAEPEGAQRIGYAVRLRGDDNSKFYRIPGLATTNKGTLIAVYDIRYNHGGDLPANVDVGVSRSEDGGSTWEPMQIGMDMGKGAKDGIGDPAVLVDKKTGRIWIAALWSHGNRGWFGSGKGLKPEETAQFMLAYSDDDGRTWSQPINITEQVKNPDWHMFFQGPGAGISMRDGTLVFAAQYQDGELKADGKKKGTPFSTLIYSKDHGKTWHAATGVKSNTTEAQVAELEDGSLMINARDNRGSFRTVGVTKDLGKTWTLHDTDRKALPDPVCMGSLLRVDSEKHGPLLMFSNPAVSGGGRYNMSVKVSKDFGATWPKNHTHLYDSRHGAGYSCLAPVGADKVGVLYEGPLDLYYLRFSVDELLGGKRP